MRLNFAFLVVCREPQVLVTTRLNADNVRNLDLVFKPRELCGWLRRW